MFDENTDEENDDYVYYRAINPYKISVLQEKNTASNVVCSQCHKNIIEDSRIRTNCGHFTCIDCFNCDLCKYNSIDKDNCMAHPTCSKCNATVTHIYLTNEENKDTYTPLEYGIKPFELIP